jgi:putative endonuclease
MAFHVYILKCQDASLYVGSTADLPSRLDAHNDGRGGRHTSSRRPVVLLYSEIHATWTEALARERQIKGWTAAKKQALAEGRLTDLKRLAARSTFAGCKTSSSSSRPSWTGRGMCLDERVD